MSIERDNAVRLMPRLKAVVATRVRDLWSATGPCASRLAPCDSF